MYHTINMMLNISQINMVLNLSHNIYGAECITN